MTTLVAGVDRWRKGWVVAVMSPTSADARPTARLRRLATYARAHELIEALADCTTVLVDMPMALPDRGTRDAERELRSYLGRSASSVFTTPTRAAISAPDQRSATEINRAHDGPGISAQAWGLVASVNELRKALIDSPQVNWFETHPESTFALLNGDTPMAKKRSAAGVGQRLDILAPLIDGLVLRDAPTDVPIDDVLDAVAAAWSACRTFAGHARIFGEGGVDGDGFDTSIRI